MLHRVNSASPGDNPDIPDSVPDSGIRHSGVFDRCEPKKSRFTRLKEGLLRIEKAIGPIRSPILRGIPKIIEGPLAEDIEEARAALELERLKLGSCMSILRTTPTLLDRVELQKLVVKSRMAEIILLHEINRLMQKGGSEKRIGELSVLLQLTV